MFVHRVYPQDTNTSIHTKTDLIYVIWKHDVWDRIWTFGIYDQGEVGIRGYLVSRFNGTL